MQFAIQRMFVPPIVAKRKIGRTALTTFDSSTFKLRRHAKVDDKTTWAKDRSLAKVPALRLARFSLTPRISLPALACRV
jgi:hypothetical protein